jgi:hypothetical protein
MKMDRCTALYFVLGEMQCHKLTRCDNMAAEHETYCMDHKPAHEPKTRCDAVLANHRQCRNWATKGWD